MDRHQTLILGFTCALCIWTDFRGQESGRSEKDKLVGYAGLSDPIYQSHEVLSCAKPKEH